ncbi:hypothetical protein [Paludisphaera rhizosphaerae]|uniref:hypothetical protein n=1 Tax=Paludisphaera rhizosphaerae TaxID=2711216 RepID=UPI0013EA54A7|nr:hypothetical protein [Paludisphaera rhizosphaerae]
MAADRRKIVKRRDRFALVGLRVTLALAFAALGCGLLLPRLSVELERAGVSPTLQLLLGASHFAVAGALLVPRLAAGVIFTLGSFVVWSVASNLPKGPLPTFAIPALLTIALFMLAVGCGLRSRAQSLAWGRMLARYAEGGGSSVPSTRRSKPV